MIEAARFHGHGRALDAWLGLHALPVARLIERVQIRVKPVLRHYYKCPDCLLPMATETVVRNALCPVCGGALDYVGPVRRERVVGYRFEVPCDARCTNATGPKCDCGCGGENHGSGRLVKIATDLGHADTRVFSEATLAKHRAMVEEYREALAQARLRVKAFDGQWQGRAMRQKIGAASVAKSHPKRMGLLREIMATP